MKEPVGLMFCLECMFKHARDLEHHLEDAVRVTKGEERQAYESLIDNVRGIRKQIFVKMTANNGAHADVIGSPDPCPSCNFA